MISFVFSSVFMNLCFGWFNWLQPLIESNKTLAETIGKIAVHCLYHRSGCSWQGTLSDCTSHCKGCSFGNYPVVCNRCGLQIVHRQVEEHAQTCSVSVVFMCIYINMFFWSFARRMVLKSYVC